MIHCASCDTNFADGIQKRCSCGQIAQKARELNERKSVPKLTDKQIIDLAIQDGVYDCLNDPYFMEDGRYSFDIDLVRFARKLLAHV